MLSRTSFYSDGRRAYVISKITEKTVTFSPVKSEYVEYGHISSPFLFETVRRATTEPEKGEPIRFRLKNNFSARGLAVFYENKSGRIAEMFELEGDTFTIEHNYG